MEASDAKVATREELCNVCDVPQKVDSNSCAGVLCSIGSCTQKRIVYIVTGRYQRDLKSAVCSWERSANHCAARLMQVGESNNVGTLQS